MIQVLFVGILFLAAVAFLGNLAVRHLRSKQDCASGCGKCADAGQAAIKPRP
jgi:hypothetical protein